VNRVVSVLWKERAMYGGASWALSPERASAKVRMGREPGTEHQSASVYHRA
jgi:hypothetical protein